MNLTFVLAYISWYFKSFGSSWKGLQILQETSMEDTTCPRMSWIIGEAPIITMDIRQDIRR
jgi:hypothetical protein